MMVRLSFFLALILCTLSVHAFESWEHKRMGDLSYHIAVRAFCDRNKNDPDCKALVKDNENIAKCIGEGIDKAACKNAAEDKIRDKYCNSIRDPLTCSTLIQQKLDNKQCQNIEDIKIRDSCIANLLKKRQEEMSQWFFDPLDKNAISENDSNSILAYTSYGDVVSCVDYFLSPEKILAGRENFLIDDPDIQKVVDRPGRLKGNPYIKTGKLFPEVRRDLDIYRHRCNDDLFNMEGARSGHVNHSHFQAELIVAQRSSHMSALMMRASEKNLFGSLTANAISDHYLHDSFAPGHITTWRSRLTDLAANSYHDYNNRRGLDVTVNAETIKEMATIPGDTTNQESLFTYIENLFVNDEIVKEHFVYAGDYGKKKCGQQCDIDSNKANEIISDLHKFIERFKLETRVKVNVKGDNQLWEMQQYQQRFVMLVSQVRSILDVLESAPKNREEQGITRSLVITDSFQNSSWSWSHLAATPEDTPPDNFIDALVSTRPSVIKASIGPVSYEINGSDNAVKANDPSAAEKINYRAMDQVLGVSFGVESMTFGDQQNRKLLTLETVVAGRAAFGRFSENWAVVTGFQQFFSPISNGSALTSRILLVKPETETVLSIQARALHLNRTEAPKVWKLSLGGRMDFGFTSFLTTYLQFNRDYATQRNGNVGQGWSIGAGLQLAAPTCRIPGLKSLNKCD